LISSSEAASLAVAKPVTTTRNGQAHFVDIVNDHGVDQGGYVVSVPVWSTQSSQKSFVEVGRRFPMSGIKLDNIHDLRSLALGTGKLDERLNPGKSIVQPADQVWPMSAALRRIDCHVWLNEACLTFQFLKL